MKKIIERAKNIWLRVVRIYKKYPVRSAAATVFAAALVTVGILFLCGVFTKRFEWDYLPKRAYVLAETETAEPRTLGELLRSDSPSVDTLLRNPSIADEIINAESLIEIIDSRFTLYNLRELNRQATERLAQSVDDVYLLDLPGDDETAAAVSFRTTQEDKTKTGLAASFLRLFDKNEIDSASSVSPLADSSPVSFSAAPMAAAAIIDQSAKLSIVNAAMERLLTPAYFGETVHIDATINMKGIWQNGEALLHMTPSCDWVPDGGYDLYRTIGGETVLIESGIASPREGSEGRLRF